MTPRGLYLLLALIVVSAWLMGYQVGEPGADATSLIVGFASGVVGGSALGKLIRSYLDDELVAP